MSRALAWALVVAVSTAASWVACGSEPKEPSASGGADAGGSGGMAAAGGGGVMGGSGGATGGSGGADGGIDWGATPKWEDTGLVAAGCPIERLANPKEITALVWKPCAWAKDCEEAVFNPELVGADPGFSASAQDDGIVARIALSFLFSNVVTVAVDAAGATLDGFRSSAPAPKCWLPASSVWGDRVAAPAGPSDGELGGVIAQIGAQPVKTFTFANPPGGRQAYPLGEKRWLWWWVPVDRFSTVSAVDGSDFTIFAKAGTGQTLMLNAPTAAGSIFLFNEVRAVGDAGQYQRVIAWSDGKLPPQTYLQPAEPGNDFGFPAFANSVVGFFKGVGRKDLNLFDSVELWSTPFDLDPSKLVPTMVAKLSWNAMPNLTGGHGVLSALTAIQPSGEHEFTAWNVEAKSNRSFVLAADRKFKALLGVSRHHVYIAAAKPNTGPSAYLIRYPVP